MKLSLFGLRTLRRRRLEVLFVFSISLLVGAAGYGIIKDRQVTMQRAHENALDIADALQVAISSQLDQSSYSIRGIRDDLSRASYPSVATVTQSLAQAMRYDPVSSFLGLVTDDRLTMVDHTGHVVDVPSLTSQMTNAMWAAHTQSVELLRLVYDGAHHTWYLPVVQGVEWPNGRNGLVFSLVPAERLARASHSLRLVPQGRFGVFTRDGVRLFRYVGQDGTFEASTVPASSAISSGVVDSTKGTFEGASAVDQYDDIFGYSWSPTLPIVIVSGIPTRSLEIAWLQRSAGPLVLLLLAIVATTGFARSLRSAVLALSRSHRLYSRLFKSVSDGLVVLQRDGTIQNCNAGASRILRAGSREALIGTNLFHLTATDRVEGLVASRGLALLQDLAAGASRTDDWRFRQIGQTDVVDVRLQLSAFPKGADTLVTALLHDVTRERQYLRQQEFHARHDSLTGLLNRYAFLEQLGAVIEAAPEGRQMIALMDLNRFKEVNDSFGHQAGDAVLEKLGARLRELMAHRNAFVARLNGDEIVVCADPQAWPGGIASLCDDLRATVQRTFMVNETSFELTATIGIALYPDDAQTPEHLVRCADIAMYAAKRAMVASERYSQSQVRVTPHSLALKSDFARAIRDGSLSLAWQPKVRLSDGALVGFEALSRWTHPVEGPISPGVFVPLAETTELVHPFTRQVIRGALQQLDAWQQAGCLASISVNISANNLLRVDFVDEVRTLLAEFGTPAGRLEFEVTESALMHEPEAALARLCELRDLGVVLSIDDFGTGYSSLGYLKRLPVKVLKIDRAFIASLQTEDADRRIVEWSIQLAHSFGMEVVAEGVETQEVAALLKAMGCDIAQGYYFGRPATAEVVAARWLTAAYVG